MPYLASPVRDKPKAIGSLIERLRIEIESPKEFGQPLIEVRDFFKTGLKGIVVIWDSWQNHSPAERTATIIQAFEIAKGRDFADQIAFASGLTFLDAGEAGKLPFLLTLRWEGIDAELSIKCRAAMWELGASSKPGSVGDMYPVFRLPTLDEVDRYKAELTKKIGRDNLPWRVVEMGLSEGD